MNLSNGIKWGALLLAFLVINAPVFSVKFKITKKDVAVGNFQQGLVTTDNRYQLIKAKVDALPELFSKIENEVNDKFSNTSLSSFMKAEANATSVVSKVSRTDNASDLEFFTVGAGLGLGFSGLDALGGANNSSKNELPKYGSSVQAACMLGLNAHMLGLPQKILAAKIDTKRLFFYVDFFTLKLDSIPGQDMNFDILDLGFHVQYRIIPSVYIAPFKLFTWTGVNVMTGFDINSVEIGMEQSISQSKIKNVETNGVKSKTTLSFKSNTPLGIENSIYSIPIEASTGVQMLYFLTLYTGIGTDFNVGSSQVSSDITGDFEMDIHDTQADTSKLVVGQGVLDLTADENLPFVNLRFFIGCQLNISLVKIFTQLSIGTSKAVALDFGLRVAY